MQFISKEIFTSNSILKCIALYIGYMTWAALNHSFGSEIWLDIPLSFYNIPSGIVIQSPEKIKIHLAAKKNKLMALDKTSLAVHIDAKNFSTGPQKIVLQENLLFLSPDFKLLNYEPQNIVVEVAYDNSENK